MVEVFRTRFRKRRVRGLTPNLWPGVLSTKSRHCSAKPESSTKKLNDAGEREDAAGLVVGLDVGLHVVANAGAPVVGLVVELGVMTDWDGDADSYRPSSAIICFMARAHSSCCDMNSGHAFSLPLILHPLL